MAEPWESDDCADVRAYHTHYPLPVAAAFWCGVPPDRVNRILEQCSNVGRAIADHPKIPCIQPRCRAMHEAIEAGALECRRDGKKIIPGEHVAPERRTVSRTALKAWISKAFPANKPEFLFDEVERTAHASINANSYRSLQADNAALAARKEKLRTALQKMRKQKDELESENRSLRKIADNIGNLGQRAETTYQNIIAALLECIAGTVPGIEKHPSFNSEAKLIEAIDQHFEGYSGLSQSTLSRKFPEAKRNLKKQ